MAMVPVFFSVGVMSPALRRVWNDVAACILERHRYRVSTLLCRCPTLHQQRGSGCTARAVAQAWPTFIGTALPAPSTCASLACTKPCRRRPCAARLSSAPRPSARLPLPSSSCNACSMTITRPLCWPSLSEGPTRPHSCSLRAQRSLVVFCAQMSGHPRTLAQAPHRRGTPNGRIARCTRGLRQSCMTILHRRPHGSFLHSSVQCVPMSCISVLHACADSLAIAIKCMHCSYSSLSHARTNRAVENMRRVAQLSKEHTLTGD